MTRFLPFAAVGTLFATARKIGRAAVTCIKDNATAETAFAKINGLWMNVLKTELIKQNGPFTGIVLPGSEGGRAVAEGTYNTLSASSGSTEWDNKVLDVTVCFENYAAGGLTLNGTLRFFDSYSYRLHHSGPYREGKTETFLCYRSKDRSSNPLPPIQIGYVQDGRRVRDAIILDADKDYTTWEVTITNGKRERFLVRV